MELYFLILLIVLMAFALGSGYPVAFALPGSAIISIGIAAGAGWVMEGAADAYFTHGGPLQWLSAGVTNFRGVYWEVERDTLIAIPLFIFMGIMLQRSKIAEDLLVTMAQLFGPVPGGLGISVVFVGALLAATTGIVGATVVAMGLISLPAMLRQNYSQSLATGTIAASGTLGQIIPPSIVLIILADQLASAVDQAGTQRKELYKAATGEFSMPSEYSVISTSAGDMFLGALVPGLLLVGIYMLYILAFALLFPKNAPAVPYEGKYDRAFYGRVLLTLVPPLTLIFLVLGSIITGIATVNQAGAIGAVGATIMAGYRLVDGRWSFVPAILGVLALVVIGVTTSMHDTNIKAITTPEQEMALLIVSVALGVLVFSILWSGWRALTIGDTLRGVMVETAKTTSLVFIILLGAAMLTAAFRAFGGEEMVKTFLEGLPGGFWTQFVIVMLVIFVLGFFLDFIEIAVVVVPIVAPILLADPSANVTAVWLGVMIGLNIQTSFLTPPFGFALFYLRGVAPAEVRTVNMYKGVVAFITLQLIALGVVGVTPQLVNYLPQRLALTSDNAPPPLNPILQFCMENYVAEQFDENGDAIRAAIDRFAGQDLSYLPKDLKRDLEKGITSARDTFPTMEKILAAQEAERAAAVTYRALHDTVRRIEKDIRKIDAELDELQTDSRRAEDGSERKARFEERITMLEAEKAAHAARVPAEWKDADAAFQKLAKAERDARTAYRRSVDAAYAPVGELITVLKDTPKMPALREGLMALRSQVPGMDLDPAMELIQEQERLVGEVEGTRDIRSTLGKARRELRGRNPKPEAAIKLIDEAIADYEENLAWRQKAEAALLPELVAYEAAIADTIGLRGQPRLPREQALFVASCSAGHRDISLSF